MYEYRNREAHKLSGGQKQRIAIAGAVAMRPDCIVFDEPTAMLDPKGRSQVMKVIRELNDQGDYDYINYTFYGRGSRSRSRASHEVWKAPR